MTDAAPPLLRREMFRDEKAFWAALIRMARTGRIKPVEPAPQDLARRDNSAR